MWIETISKGKYKYIERYIDPYTEKEKRVSVMMSSKSAQSTNKARIILDDKINERLSTRKVKKVPFKIIYDEWYLGHKKSLRPTSIGAYNSITKIIFDHVEDDILINNMDARYLQKMMNQMDYSNQYIAHIKSILNLVFRYAKDIGIIERNPTDDVKVIKRAKTLADYNKLEEKYLEIEQAELLFEELYRNTLTYRLGRLAEFLFLTGCRIGEAVVLKPSDIDFENKILKITGTLDSSKGYKNSTKGPPKTINSRREIMLTDRTINLIKRSIDENKLDVLTNEKYIDRGYIFVTKSGTPVQNNSFNIALKRAGNRIEIENKQLSSHIFRHTHVSILAENNVPQKAIMERVGHEDSKITSEIYTHVTSKMKNNITKTLELNGL